MKAAIKHAKRILGEDQFKNNKIAVKSIVSDFKAGFKAATNKQAQEESWKIIESCLWHDNDMTIRISDSTKKKFLIYLKKNESRD